MQNTNTIKENTTETITNLKDSAAETLSNLKAGATETVSNLAANAGETLTGYVSGLKQNVNDNERIISTLAGGGLITYGIAKGGIFGAVMSLIGGGMVFRGATGHCHVYDALDKTTAEPKDTKINVQKSVTIDKSPAELFQFWSNFENLPQFMNHLESVTVLDDKRSHWKAKAPLGYSVEWDAETSGVIENERVSWHSVEGSEITNSGTVEFKPTSNRGTEVRVTLVYEPPTGKIGAAIAKLFGEEPSQQIAEDLRRFKSLMETGLIMHIEGQPSARISEIAAEKEKAAKA